MSRAMPVIKREFAESVRTKMFIIGTLFGPLLILAIFFLPALMMRGGVSERSIAIVDESGSVGAQVAEMLKPPEEAVAQDASDKRTIYTVEIVDPAGRDAEAVRADLAPRVEAEELDGVLWVPADVLAGGEVRYEGENATSFSQMAELRTAVQQTVQQQRLAGSGIDQQALAVALQRVPFEARTPSGTGESLFLLAWVVGYAMMLVVMLFGFAVMRGALEEKRDKIVEVVMSSITARDLLLGKVLGIGGAALVQVSVWVIFAAITLTQGETIAAKMGVTLPELPVVPAAVGVVLLLFFAGGFFLYASLYASIGAIATTDQEAQQLTFPIQLLLMVAFFMMFSVANNAEGTASVAGSMIPFTSPLIMPMRMALSSVPPTEVAIAVVLLFGTGLGVVWAAAKIYRIGMLATGKKPSMREVARWIRTA